MTASNTTNPRVLVVDDADDVQLMAKQALAKRFQVTAAQTLGDARDQLAKGRFDLVILDVTLPDGNGIDFCRSLCQAPDYAGTPVILLTSMTDIADKLEGFSAGADDYIVKPFHPSELEVRATVRVNGRARREEPAPPRHGETVATLGDLRFDLRAFSVHVLTGNRQTELPLTLQEFKLLLCLARAGGRILSREEIVSQVWDHDLRVTHRTVDTHVCKLRKKISQSTSRFAVQAVYGAGYRFVEPGQYFEKE